MRIIEVRCERCGREIVIDFVRYPDFSSNAWYASLTTGSPRTDVRQGTLARATIDPQARTFRCEPASNTAVEFSHVASFVTTRPHRFVYVTSHSSPVTAITGPQDRRLGCPIAVRSDQALLESLERALDLLVDLRRRQHLVVRGGLTP